MVAVRFTRIHAGSVAPAVRFLHIHAQAEPTDPTPPTSLVALRFTRIHAQAGAPLTGLVARAGADRTVQGFASVTLDGTSSAGYTGLAWSQTSGPAVTLGPGGVVTFPAPAVATGAVLTFQLTATGSAGSAGDSVTITVLPWLHWRWDGTQAVPERLFFFGAATAASSFPDSGLFPDSGRFPSP